MAAFRTHWRPERTMIVAMDSRGKRIDEYDVNPDPQSLVVLVRSFPGGTVSSIGEKVKGEVISLCLYKKFTLYFFLCIACDLSVVKNFDALLLIFLGHCYAHFIT